MGLILPAMILFVIAVEIPASLHYYPAEIRGCVGVRSTPS